MRFLKAFYNLQTLFKCFCIFVAFPPLNEMSTLQVL